MTHLDRNRANKMLQESVARVPVCAIAEKHTSAILVRINFVRKKKIAKYVYVFPKFSIFLNAMQSFNHATHMYT